jgi:hypothetical protein
MELSSRVVNPDQISHHASVSIAPGDDLKELPQQEVLKPAFGPGIRSWIGIHE